MVGTSVALREMCLTSRSSRSQKDWTSHWLRLNACRFIVRLCRSLCTLSPGWPQPCSVSNFLWSAVDCLQGYSYWHPCVNFTPSHDWCLQNTLTPSLVPFPPSCARIPKPSLLIPIPSSSKNPSLWSSTHTTASPSFALSLFFLSSFLTFYLLSEIIWYSSSFWLISLNTILSSSSQDYVFNVKDEVIDWSWINTKSGYQTHN